MIKCKIANVEVAFDIFDEDAESDIMTVVIDGPEHLVHKMTDLVKQFGGDDDNHITELNLTLVAYREQNINQYNKLNDIQKCVELGRGGNQVSYMVMADEISKIIQEE